MPKTDRIIREPERRTTTGVPKSTWLKMMDKGKAPGAVRLSEHTKGWRLSDIQKWIDERQAA